MAVSGLVLRPLKKIGVSYSRKRAFLFSTQSVRWVVVFLLVVVTGLAAYTKFQGRTNHRQDYDQQHGSSDEKATNLAPSIVNVPFGDENRQGEALKEKDVVVSPLDTIFPNSRLDSMILRNRNEDQKDDPDHTDSEIQTGIQENVQKISSISNSSVFLATHDVNGVLSGNSNNSPDIAKDQQGTFSVETSVNNEEVSITNAPNNTDKFECPEAFRVNDPDSSWFQRSIVQKSGKYVVQTDAIDDILILTPISNVKRHLRKYFENICSLTYPHQHISIVLGEDSSSDSTLEAAQGLADEVRSYFRRVQVLKLKGSSRRTSGGARHEMSWQMTRRRHLAMARNQLLFGALRSEKWVLWMDSDVRHIPSDLVERLLWPSKAIVTANCLYRMSNGQTDTFDRNTWRDTAASKRRLAGVAEDFLMLEGYGPTQRKTLNDLKEEGDVVRLDGVGGCVLLIEGDLHRKGLVFPSFVFDHHVETEGLAKMAARMKIGIFGLPSVNVIHW